MTEPEYLSVAPVRLCCGTRHYDSQCPDGKVMCCLCFSRFEVPGLVVDQDGCRWDVCLGCAPEGDA